MGTGFLRGGEHKDVTQRGEGRSKGDDLDRRISERGSVNGSGEEADLAWIKG